MLDVLIVGGGVSGCAIARELSRYQLHIALLERAPDVAMGATKANSAIVHGGYAESHKTLKGRLCYRGRRQFAALEEELHFGFTSIGSMVLAFTQSQITKLEAMERNGIKNGLPDLSILTREQVLEKEPNCNPAVVAALYCAGAGVCSPYELAIALAENAIANGVELHVNSRVEQILPSNKTENAFCVKTTTGHEYHTRYVVNAAGLQAAEVAEMAGACSFEIHPRSGEYMLMAQGSGAALNHVLFQMPTKMGKGVLVTPTVYGNLLIGPDALDETTDDRDTHPERLYHIYKEATHTTTALNINQFLRSFAGVRPVANTNDFIIEQSRIPHFIQVAGIQSPGLTASPAVAEMVCNLLRGAGLRLAAKETFNPARRATYLPQAPLTGTALQPLLDLPLGAKGRRVCRCEQVPESALRDAAGRGIPLTTVDAAKRRTRAGMGWCQGAFCQPRVAELLGTLTDKPIDARTDAERDGLRRVTREKMLAYYTIQENTHTKSKTK